MQEKGYDTNVPIYLQLIEKIQRMIVTGEWQAGERIPAVRELALAFAVNPNTMQRALAELERDGLLYSERTAGRFVTQDRAHIRRLRDSLAGEVLRDFLSRMEGLGCTRDEILSLLQRELEGDGMRSGANERKEEER